MDDVEADNILIIKILPKKNSNTGYLEQIFCSELKLQKGQTVEHDYISEIINRRKANHKIKK